MNEFIEEKERDALKRASNDFERGLSCDLKVVFQPCDCLSASLLFCAVKHLKSKITAPESKFAIFASFLNKYGFY